MSSSRPSSEMESYIAAYAGHTRLKRLQFIAQHEPTLRAKALRIAVEQARQGVNTALYQELCATEGCPVARDDAWVDSVEKKASARLDKLESDLASHKTSLVKESIRMGHSDLGDFHASRGDFATALKCYVRTRDYCTTSRHTLSMCLAVVKSTVLPEVAGTLPRDLAECPGPTDTGFASPPLEGAALSALALTADEVERFDRDGFVATAQPVLSQSQLEQLRRDLDALCDQANPHPKLDLLNELHYNEAAGSGQVLFHCLGHWRCEPSFHDIAFLDPVVLPASQLLHGRPVRLWHDQAFVKPGGAGACVQWHQDFSYWDRTGPMAHLTVHIALDNQTLENGALHWVPGSHRWTRNGGPLPQAAKMAREKMERAKAAGGGADLAAASFSTDMDALYNDVLTEEEKRQWAERPPESVLLKAGHAAFHHALSVHGSWGNRSAEPRRALVLNYFAHGTRSLMDGALMNGLPAVSKGQMLGGVFHPVVFDTRRVDMAALPVASV